jgi:hypothetical protein
LNIAGESQRNLLGGRNINGFIINFTEAISRITLFNNMLLQLLPTNINGTGYDYPDLPGLGNH